MMEKPMLVKYLIFIMILSLNVFAADPDPYVEALHEKRFLQLPNGNEILISYHSPTDETNAKIRIFMRQKDKTLWDKTFVNEFDEIWNKANFIPVTKDKFVKDLNDDGLPEIGIANWSGGKAPCASSAIIFTVKHDSLQFLRKQQINTEFSRSIYQKKSDFKNSKYRTPLCID